MKVYLSLFYKEKKMRAFFNTKSIIARVVIVSLIAGGFVLAGAFAVNVFVPTPIEASSCCGNGDQDTTADCNSSDMMNSDGDDTVVTLTSTRCTCAGSTCGSCCLSSKCDGGTKPGCPDNASCKGTDGCSCDGRICKKASQCSGSCG